MPSKTKKDYAFRLKTCQDNQHQNPCDGTFFQLLNVTRRHEIHGAVRFLKLEANRVKVTWRMRDHA